MLYCQYCQEITNLRVVSENNEGNERGPKLSLWVFGHNEKFMIYCSVVQEQNMGSGASKNPASGITEDMIDQKKYMVVKNSTGEVRLRKRNCC